MTVSDDERIFTDADGVDIAFRLWLPLASPRAIVQIAHGASEHSGCYARFAGVLTDRGYAVVANDHRGHGATAKATGVGVAGPRGWSSMIDDVRELGVIARRDIGDVPLVLFGHSMGSFVAQRFVQRFGNELAGVVLSGSTGAIPGLDASIAALGALPPEDVPAAPNASEPARTRFDWLSRDSAEVDAYLADPMCGDNAPLTTGFLVDMLRELRVAWLPENERRIPAELPVLLVTGEADPVSDGAATMRALETRYRANGMSDVTAHYYPGARHKLLSETNRDEVHADIAQWLDRVTG